MIEQISDIERQKQIPTEIKIKIKFPSTAEQIVYAVVKDNEELDYPYKNQKDGDNIVISDGGGTSKEVSEEKLEEINTLFNSGIGKKDLLDYIKENGNFSESTGEKKFFENAYGDENKVYIIREYFGSGQVVEELRD